jgi:VWFA-related protein
VKPGSGIGRVSGFIVLITILCANGTALRAQQGAVIRAETRVVLVDAIVTDKQGQYVHDLTAKDFRVWQDNKAQTIQSVSVEHGTVAGNSRPRYLVLFFAGMEAADRIAALRAVSGFVDANADENRLMSVVSYNGGPRIEQNFTDSPTRLKEAVKRVMSSVAASAGGDSEPLDTVRALGNLARSLSVLPGRKIVLFVNGGLPQTSVQRAEMAATIEACNKADVAIYPIDVRPLSARQGSGPRSIGTASEGAGRRDMIDPRPRGLQGQRSDPDAEAQDTGSPNQQALFGLANGTGGFVVTGSGEMQAGLQRVGEEQSEYYVLSYTPAEAPGEKKEAGCHTLRVKVDRGGTTVRARSNYCESKPQDLLAGTIAGQDLERRAAAGEASTAGASMQLAYFYLSPGVARVDVAMEIPAEVLRFEMQKSKSGKSHSSVSPQAEINLLGIATDKEGGVGARFSDALKLDADVMGKPLHYEKEFKIAPGQYSFTMAFSSGGESFGKLEAPLSVEAWKAGDLALSGLVLSKETRAAAELGLGLAGLTDGLTPLVTDGAQIVPSASNRFAKNETGYFYFEVYAPDPGSVRVGVKVLDAKSGEPRFDSGLLQLPRPKSGGNDAIPGGSRLPLEGLAAGAYRLEITAVDGAQRQARRTAEFEIK